MSAELMQPAVVKGYILPGVPHILLAADKNPGWKKVRQAMDEVKAEIAALDNPRIQVAEVGREYEF